MSTSELSTYAPQATGPQSMGAGGRRPPRNLLLGMMVAVFFSGGVIGSGSTLMLINHRIEDNEKHHNDPVIITGRVVKELEEKLSLNEQQTAQVQKIMKDHLAALDRLRREKFLPVIREEFNQMEGQVNAVLDDEQRSQWQAWLAERRQRVCPPGGRHGYSGHRARSSNGSAAERGVKPKNGDATTGDKEKVAGEKVGGENADGENVGSQSTNQAP